MSVLSIEAVEKSYFGRKILDKISLAVNKGDKLALIGDNGAGKSTLFNCISKKEVLDGGRIVLASGVVPALFAQSLEEVQDDSETALNHPVLEKLEKDINAYADLIASSQTDSDRQNAMSKYSLAMAAFESMGAYDYKHRLAQILAGLGFDGDLLERPLIHLSGGERMRVQMARLLITNPDLLLLDEPTNHLDIAGIEWLEDYIIRFGGTCIFISHDRSFIDNCATRVAELSNANLFDYNGNYSQYLIEKEIQADYARQEVARLKEAVSHEEDVVQTMLSHRKFGQYHSREKKVVKLSNQLNEAKKLLNHGPMRMNFHFIPKEFSGDRNKIILETEDLAKSFGDLNLFKDLNFNLRANEHQVIAGPNGCGKTTLLKILSLKDTEFEGKIKLADQITYASMGQHIPFEDETLRVYDELSRRSDLNETEIRNRLARFGFTDVTVFKEIKVLSGGERARLYLCCLLEEQPDLLFLDEPTNHLDIHSRNILEQALEDYSGAILAVSHDRYFIERIADKVQGFIGQEIRPYQKYQHYRQDARQFEMEQSKIDAKDALAKRLAKEKELEKSKKPIGKSPATLRREAAKRVEQMQALEREMDALEAEKTEIEANISETTPADTYERLAEILQLIEDKQDLYLLLAIEHEELA